MERGIEMLDEFGLLVADHVSAMLAYWDKKFDLPLRKQILCRMVWKEARGHD